MIGTGCSVRASGATTGVVLPSGQAGSSWSYVTRVWIAVDCCYSERQGEQNSQATRKSSYLSSQIDLRHSPLAPVAPHPPRSARDAPNTMERVGVRRG